MNKLLNGMDRSYLIQTLITGLYVLCLGRKMDPCSKKFTLIGQKWYRISLYNNLHKCLRGLVGTSPQE